MSSSSSWFLELEKDDLWQLPGTENRIGRRSTKQRSFAQYRYVLMSDIVIMFAIMFVTMFAIMFAIAYHPEM